MKTIRFNKRAISVMEYALVFGMVSIALIAMNIYIKRGVQSRARDLTVYFLGSEQVAELNPTGETATDANVTSTSNSTASYYKGGSAEISINDVTTANTKVKAVDDGIRR